ncbi:mitochondrial coenzyme A diphosphatase NUDT8-like [Daphnia carinata]|uniref:mitochondrial coenzyme A diphosphatase NUDT8-like n=1 Tax=Daphnia carinata TaxID=120202 RepID=UPI00257FEA6D|nr:mitochondrial coenzyme A diphosphatase NUDT8-like [Daphnia carinata]
MISKKFFPFAIHRGFCCVPPFTACELFSQERKKSLQDKVSKLHRARSSSIRGVVDGDKIGLLKRAAVLVPLVLVNDQSCLLYTARSSNLRSHGGEISFPGGKFDSVDKNAEGAALRETEEELGLNRDLFEIWAQLPSLQGRDGKTAITPVIALLKEPLILSSLKPNPEEVSNTVICTVAELCEEKNQAFTQFMAGYTLPVYFGQQTNDNCHPKIWGLTAIITHLTLSALIPDVYKLKLPFVKRICRISSDK